MSSGLTPGIVLFHMDQGMKQADIAREYGVSRQYVHSLAKQGGYVSPIGTVGEHMPWEVRPESYKHPSYMAMRLVGHMAVSPSTLELESVERAYGFIQRLKSFDVVIDYNPSYPPQPGVSNFPGFAYLPRTVEDEDYVMKIRPGVKLTKLGREIWRMPDEEYFDFVRGEARKV